MCPEPVVEKERERECVVVLNCNKLEKDRNGWSKQCSIKGGTVECVWVCVCVAGQRARIVRFSGECRMQHTADFVKDSGHVA